MYFDARNAGRELPAASDRHNAVHWSNRRPEFIDVG
jgi:hypothetical protein